MNAELAGTSAGATSVTAPLADARAPAWRLRAGASALALLAGLAFDPAAAQLLRQRAATGVGVTPAATAAAAGQNAAATIVRPATAAEALARAQALQSRTDQVRSFLLAARNAGLAATRTQPGNGLTSNGLVPIAGIREAMQKAASADQSVRDQVPGILVGLQAARDTTGLNTWQNLNLPTQTTEGSRTIVNLVQTDARAIASWDRFDIGAQTTLRIQQQSAGVDQPGWTLVNRVANAVAPSTILGRIEAPGTVVVLNNRGIIFGQGAEVNAYSFLASSLEIGGFLRRTTQAENARFNAAAVVERNLAFLQNGLFSGVSTAPADTTNLATPLLFSPQYAPGNYPISARPALEGAVEVDPGASLTTKAGGVLVLAAPSITNAGSLSATDGQVSLQAGRFITYRPATGAEGSIDPDVRGYVLDSIVAGVPQQLAPSSQGDDGQIVNSGVITSTRGYASLGATIFGNVTSSGLIDVTTSVARNGKIGIYAGTVSLAGNSNAGQAGGLRILPDNNGETIPQGTAESPPDFKPSSIVISGFATSIAPIVFSMGANSFILAPGADVTIGRDPSVAVPTGALDAQGLEIYPYASSITLGENAVIDVGGVKGVQVDGNRNYLTIDPIKRNELRDTPTYREVRTDGGFTLNGTVLTVDIRKTGVRADGVRWVGSPLLEAGSAASQIGVTAAELLTRGGTLRLGAASIASPGDAAAAPSVRIAASARLDLSGGWVSYSDATKGASRLLTADGRIVDISLADPNDVFVGVVDGFTDRQDRFGVVNTFRTPLASATRFEPGYTEGRDAGALIVSGGAIDLKGQIFGNAYAGRVQIGAGTRGSATSDLKLDTRALQAERTELPSGGFVRIGSFDDVSGASIGAAITLYRGRRSDSGFWLTDTLLDADMLSAAGLSGLRLQSSGGVTLAAAGDLAGLPIADAGRATLTLAPGGSLAIDAGRSILFNGDVTAPAGRIEARTYELAAASGSLGLLTAQGSAFTTADDLRIGYEIGAQLPGRTFDILVNGNLSVAGLWTNTLVGGDAVGGGAFLDGGSISLAVAPKVLVNELQGGVVTNRAVDLSGRIEIAASARLNLAAGGYVNPDRSFDLSGLGGDLRLANETSYASLQQTFLEITGDAINGTGNQAINGTNQTVDFTPNNGVVAQIMPTVRRAAVLFNEASISAFGFAGGGTFELVAPDIRFNEAFDPAASNLSLDVLARTGFGTLALKSFRSRFFENLFSNGRGGVSAFLDTTSFRIRAGQTLDLTQVALPRFLDFDQSAILLGLGSGSDVVEALRPTVAGGRFAAPSAVFDRHAANLRFEGLTELVVDAGGSIVTAAPGARIDTPRLLNNGTIRLPGGTIAQRDVLSPFIGDRVLAVRGPDRGGIGLGAVLGPADANGQFDENYVDPVLGVTTRSLFSVSRQDTFLIFAGALELGEGVRLGAGSVTDLSGGPAIYDPRAAFQPDGQLRFGLLPDGGTVSTAAAQSSLATGLPSLFDRPTYGAPRTSSTATPSLAPLQAIAYARSFTADRTAVLDLSGSSGLFDEAVNGGRFAPSLDWSRGGNLSVLGGGALTAGVVRANGGTAQAIGGTLEWLRPTLAATGGNGALGSDAIAAAGFDTLVARGGFTVSGTVALNLDKALFVASAPELLGPNRGSLLAADADYSIGATAGARATITAPYVRFENRVGSSTAAAAASVGDGQLTVAAGANGFDIVGALTFGDSLGTVRLTSDADLRFSGVNDVLLASSVPQLNGEVLAFGSLTFDAARVYGTTGTGNLQRSLEDLAAGSALTTLPFRITADRLTIASTGARANANRAAPLSAGSYLRLTASSITQNGALYAPFGVLEIGSNGQATILGEAAPGNTGTGSSTLRTVATRELNFGAGSLTSVSGAGLSVPYGTTTDLLELFFAPTTSAALSTIPTGELRLSAGTVNLAGNTARIDGRGGGDTFAFEFVSGIGGSRDVLSRFNTDLFSSNNFDAAAGTGLQFADGRQVFALLPVAQAGTLAPIDPIYSADYGSSGPVDLYGAAAGRMVRLDPGPGFAGGDYLLLPGHYALLPGALRLVENVGARAPAPDQAQQLLDGSFVVSGSFATAGTNFVESTRRSFTVQDRATFGRYARIETTTGSTAITRAADTAGVPVGRLPADAARVVLAPLQALAGTGFFDTAPAAGGRGAQVDIAADNIVVAANGATATAGALTLTPVSLASLNADSLFLGGSRVALDDGRTGLRVTARSLEVQANVALQAPELLLAVGARNLATRPTLTIAAGATISATGTLADTSTADYVIATVAGDGSPVFDQTGIGAAIRVANGPERLIVRTGPGFAANANRPVQVTIGAASISGQSVALDSSGQLTINRLAAIGGDRILLSGDQLLFANNLTTEQLARYQAASRLTLVSSSRVRFGAGSYDFGNLIIDAPGIGLQASPRGQNEIVNLASDSLTLRNSSGVVQAPCATVAICGDTGNRLLVTTGELSFGSGVYGTFGFDNAVAITANQGIYFTGVGTFDTSATDLTLTTPFIVDRRVGTGSLDTPPSLTILTNAGLGINGQTFAASLAPAGERAPGARLNLGSVDRLLGGLTVDSARLIVTAGIIDANVSGDIGITGTAALLSPGYRRSFGDAVDPYTVLAPSGTVSLASTLGNITLGANARLDADDGTAGAGTLRLLAGRGFVDIAGRLNSATGVRAASLAIDAGLAAPGRTSAFDLGGFLTANASRFQGDIAIRSGAGDLAIAAGQTLNATSVSLTADGGQVRVDGRINTAGVDVTTLSAEAAKTARVDGGDISLFGNAGVTLGATAQLDTRTSGYAATDSRVAAAGDVTIGIGNNADARLTIAQGASVDVSARRPGNRLVAEPAKDALTLGDITVYRFVESDTGGDVLLRAPVLAGGRVGIELANATFVRGAASQSIEGYRTYDLDALAAEGVLGVAGSAGRNIDLNTDPDNPFNIFADDFVLDDLVSVPNFVRNFAITATGGAGFNGFRQRPGVEITSTTRINLVSNWNLAAAEVDIPAAVAAGLMVPVTQYLRVGEPAFAVVAGQEGALLERSDITRFFYRVGGRADGEAPIITIRGAGPIRNQGISEISLQETLGNSITDGFFNFHDRSDPDYVSYQLGGGTRFSLPSATLTCAALAGADCGLVASFFDITNGDTAFVPGSTIEPGNGIAINLTQIVAGLVPGGDVLAPYNPLANAPGALSSRGFTPDGTEIAAGDPLGTAELFPLINNGADTIRSSSYRLVAGADLASADPLRVDRSRPADLVLGSIESGLTGDRSYRLAANRGGDFFFTNLAGTRDPDGAFALSLRITPSPTTTQTVFFNGLANRDLLTQPLGDGAPLESNADSYTVLTWGAGQGTRARFLRDNALRYFNINFTSTDLADFAALTTEQRDALTAGDRRLVGIAQGPASGPTGIAVRLSDALAFLDWQYQGSGNTVGAELARLIVTGAIDTPTILPPAPISYVRERDVNIGTRIRTGDGSIALAASGDVDTRRTPDVAYRAGVDPAGNLGVAAQVGGAAIYTAGVRIATAANLTATTGSAGTTLRWNADTSITEPLSDADYLPVPRGQYLQDPVLSHNGGAIRVSAGRDVLGRRDVFSEIYLSESYSFTRNAVRGGAQLLNNLADIGDAALRIGPAGQAWRVGASGTEIVAASVPDLFRSGIAALAGGDVSVSAGRDVVELTVVTANNAVNTGTGTDALLTADTLGGGTPRVLATFGNGDVGIAAGRSVVGGQIDVASGQARVTAGDAIAAATINGTRDGVAPVSQRNDLRLRVSDATVALVARSSVAFDSISSLGLDPRGEAALRSRGDMTAVSGLDVLTNGMVSFAAAQSSVRTPLLVDAYNENFESTVFLRQPGLVLPGTLNIAALGGDFDFGDNTVSLFLLPSRLGQLRILSGGDIDPVRIAMSDANPAFLPGNFSIYSTPLAGQSFSPNSVEFGFPAVTATVTDLRLRNFHNQTPTHRDNPEPVRIAADGDITDLVLNTPKQTRLFAGEDLINAYFTGQNLAAGDVTRIVTGGDIRGTLAIDGAQATVVRRPFVLANNFVLGGPGSLVVQAGRNLGPFLSSADVGSDQVAGGIRTIGNFSNPWLGSAGADIRTLFGVANGADYTALRETYLNPSSFGGLDGDLFVQYTDVSGNKRPLNPANVAALLADGATDIPIELLDSSGALITTTLRTPAVLPVRAATLATWLQAQDPAGYAAAIAGISAEIGNAGTPAQQAEARFIVTAGLAAGNLYTAFARLDTVRQESFLAGDLLFAELREPALPNSPSFNQFIRGYRAVQTLFPTSLGYTDNLAAYNTDPATVSVDHPLGVPLRRIGADGQPLVADRVLTGNADLRLSTIQTLRGGDITFVAPGGDLIAGSVVRTSEQISRRNTAARLLLEAGRFRLLNGSLDLSQEIRSVPLGLEGVLSLQSGQLRGFFDGDFRLNQSRAFSIGGGNLSFWSSNGDLNAGQGPRSASSFPPVTIRQTPDGLAEVNSVGSVAGAGIGSFLRNPDDPPASIVLVAPVGEVDAGDAGVRASGDIFVAAARVANADNFKAGGSVSGVPSAAGSVTPPPPPGSTATQQAAAAAAQQGNANERRSVINVEVLGAVDPCADPNNRDPNCAPGNR